MVDSSALAQLQSQAAAGAAAAATLATQERERVLTSALGQGRIAPTDVEKWRGQYDRDPAGTTTMLSSLAQVFPTSMLGAGGDLAVPLEGASIDATHAAFMGSVFGEEMALTNQFRGATNG
jgi:hypothetical protein